MRVDATACSYTSEMAAAGTYRPQRSAQVPVSFLEARSTPNTRSDAGNHYPRGRHPRMLLRNQPDVRLRAPGGIPERSKGSDCKSDGYAFPGSNPGPAIGLCRLAASIGVRPAC